MQSGVEEAWPSVHVVMHSENLVERVFVGVDVNHPAEDGPGDLKVPALKHHWNSKGRRGFSLLP